MIDIRQEIQEWLELVTRSVKNIPFDNKVEWYDIEDIYIGDYYTPEYKSHSELLSFEAVYIDAISIDQMCLEILDGDFEKAMKIIARYKGIFLTDSIHFNTELARRIKK
jgi:hypothetical protein